MNVLHSSHPSKTLFLHRCHRHRGAPSSIDGPGLSSFTATPERVCLARQPAGTPRIKVSGVSAGTSSSAVQISLQLRETRVLVLLHQGHRGPPFI